MRDDQWYFVAPRVVEDVSSPLHHMDLANNLVNRLSSSKHSSYKADYLASQTDCLLIVSHSSVRKT